MKVLNYTTSYFAVVLLALISIWAIVFYYAMLDEIYDSIDDGLDNQKGLIIQRAGIDTSILSKASFEEGDYNIRPIDATYAKSFRDLYVDTMMFMHNEQDFEPVRLLRTIFRHNGKYYQMQVITSMVEEDDLIRELVTALVWLYIGLVISILLLNNILLKRIWRPFYHLLKQIKNFRLERPSDIETKSTTIDEFKLLNDTIQKLIGSNVAAYNSQKHFIENASHELQTPLAISINKLEALAESNSLSHQDLQLLSSALDNLQRLTRLNKSLLLLSKIENKQFVVKENINLNELVTKIVADFSDQLTFSQLTLDVDEQGIAIVQMNAELAAVMITNIIKNAIVHNHAGGSIKIVLQNHAIAIANTGKAGAMNERNLFTRFNTEERSNNSTGLGLAIVKAIIDLHSFKISYTYANTHILTISFD
ncbi:MAG: HAMP domain-containing sensor histidine kinase [Chitinophagaceae bacterium]